MAAAWKALESGYVWGSRRLSWSDPDRSGDYGGGYADDAPHRDFSRLSAQQLASVRLALDLEGPGPSGRAGFAVEGFTGLHVRYVGGGSGSADLRYGNTSDASTAYGYLPGHSAEAGDVWFGPSGATPLVGDYHHMTVIHETGHALGLDHPHEGGRHGRVPAAWDTLEFTAMSYRPWQGASPQALLAFERWGAPQTWMMLDIAALQDLYGANFSVNAGATVYRWKPGEGTTWVNSKVGIDPGGAVIFATIWDGGGRDRYDLDAYADDLRIDLAPGGFSVFDRDQLSYLGGGPNHGHARGSIFNALQFEGDRRSLIEDARGGSGDDRIAGNAAGNRLDGGAGDDRLVGRAGSDRLVGGRGEDVFVFARAGDSAPAASDRLVKTGGVAAFQGAGERGGDVIDLRAIDADVTRAGNQGFVLDGRREAGRLWLVEDNVSTLVRASVDRDARAEYELRIEDGAVGRDDYRGHDFLL